MKDNKEELKYYSLDAILKKKAQYNVIFGERSNGKTFASLKYALENFIKTGKQFAYVRRYDDDIKQGKLDSLFDALIDMGIISDLTGGRYTTVSYYNRRFYLAFYDENLDKDIRDSRPFCYTFAVNTATRYKSTSYPDVTTIIYDEFLDRKFYLPNEFADFMSIVSTIVRTRDDVKIFMLGNTVNKTCPYFTEMGLYKVSQQAQGTIDVYSYGKTKLKVAVEYCGKLNASKPSDVYFAFNNPRLNMITSGVWEMAMYPHQPCKYIPKEVVMRYFIIFDGNTLQCDIVDNGKMNFTYIFRKPDEIKNPDTDIVYSLDFDPRPNYVRRLLKPTTKWQKRIAQYFVEDNVYYQDNEVGEIVRNYLNVSSTDKFR